jgi:hypothetical protein
MLYAGHCISPLQARNKPTHAPPEPDSSSPPEPNQAEPNQNYGQYISTAAPAVRRLSDGPYHII